MNRKQRRAQIAMARKIKTTPYLPEDFTITLPEALSPEGEAELRAYVATLGCTNLTINIEAPAA